MPRRRDRHDRGIRGPLVGPGPASALYSPASRMDFFTRCVDQAVSQVLAVDPRALDNIEIGVEEVPYLQTQWSRNKVPLSAGLEAVKGRHARLVLYQRPLERRADGPSELRRLVYRTFVEQLSTLSGSSIEELGGDPTWD